VPVLPGYAIGLMKRTRRKGAGLFGEIIDAIGGWRGGRAGNDVVLSYRHVRPDQAAPCLLLRGFQRAIVLCFLNSSKAIDWLPCPAGLRFRCFAGRDRIEFPFGGSHFERAIPRPPSPFCSFSRRGRDPSSLTAGGGRKLSTLWHQRNTRVGLADGAKVQTDLRLHALISRRSQFRSGFGHKTGCGPFRFGSRRESSVFSGGHGSHRLQPRTVRRHGSGPDSRSKKYAAEVGGSDKTPGLSRSGFAADRSADRFARASVRHTRQPDERTFIAG